MNAVDHPHGGGRGKSKGNVHPVSIWGTPVSHISISCASSSMLTRIVGERRLQDAQEAQSEPACCSGKTTQSRKAKSEEIAGSICHRKHLRHSMSIKSQIEMPSSCTCSHTWYLFSYCLFVGSASESRGLGLMGSDISTSYLHWLCPCCQSVIETLVHNHHVCHRRTVSDSLRFLSHQFCVSARKLGRASVSRSGARWPTVPSHPLRAAGARVSRHYGQL